MATHTPIGTSLDMVQSVRGRSSMTARCARPLAVVLLAGGCVGSPALAGPEGEKVVRGDVTFDRSQAGTTLIHAGDRAIIDYRSFDIASGETVRFVQPSADARVLNRIESAAPTRIDGSLLANGRVYIVNPNGVVFGRGATVDVAGLTAAAGRLSNENFVSGVDHFTGLTGAVTNEGQITAQRVVLAGAAASNIGTISAPSGTVVLAAGEDVLVGERGGSLFVRVEGSGLAGSGSAGVTNSGTVDAVGGSVFMGAGDMFSLAIRQEGTVRAESVRIEGQGSGQVVVGGTITADAASANSAKGDGFVAITGEKVRVEGAAITAHGGDVRIGGGWQGKDDGSVSRNARSTSVDRDSRIDVSGVGSGSGGSVVVWSDGATRYDGVISARSGVDGAQGGMVEVSGSKLAFTGKVDAGSAKGRGGTLLLDPKNIRVVDGGSSFLPGGFGDDAGDDSNIDAEAITGVTDTGTGVVLQANNDISIEEAINTNNTAGRGGSITLQAGRSVLINAAVNTDGGDFVVLANADGAIGANRDAGVGNIVVNAPIDARDLGEASGGLVRFDIGTGSTAPFEAGNVLLGANVTGGEVRLNSATTLTADSRLSAGFGFVSLNASVNDVVEGAHRLSLQGAEVLVGRDIGNAQALLELTLDTPLTRMLPGNRIITTGAQGYLGKTELAGTVRSNGGGAIHFYDDVTLVGETIVGTTPNAGTAGNVLFERRVSGAGQALTVDTRGSSLAESGAIFTHFVETGGDQYYYGTVSVDGNMSGTALVFDGPVLLDNSATFTGTTRVVFDGTLESREGRDAEVVVISPSTFFNASVGGAAGRELGGLLTDQDGATFISASNINSTGAVVFGDDVRLDDSLTINAGAGNNQGTSGGGVRFEKSLNSASTSLTRSLLVNTTGSTPTIFGVVGNLASLSSILTNGDGVTVLTGNVRTSGSQVYSDAVTVGGDITLTGNTISLVQVESDATPRNLIVNGGDRVSLDGVVGGIAPLNSLVVSGTNISSVGVFTRNLQTYTGTMRLGGELASTSVGAITINGALNIAADSTIRTAGLSSSDDISITGLINGTGGSFGLSLLAGTAGEVPFTKNIGATTPLSYLHVTAGQITLLDVNTSNGQVYNGAIALNGNLTSTAQAGPVGPSNNPVPTGIVLNGPTNLRSNAVITTLGGSITLGTVDSEDSATPRGLVVSTGGSSITRLTGRIGGTRRLLTLQTNEDGTTRIETDTITTSGDQIFNDNVILANAVTITGNDLTFNGEVNSDSDATPRTLSLVKVASGSDSGETIFAKNVGTRVALTSISTNNEGTTRFGNNQSPTTVRTLNGMNFGDATLVAGETTLDGGAGGLFFFGALNAHDSVTDPKLTLKSTAVGTADPTTIPFRFRASIGATRRLGTLNLGSDLSAVQQYSTIVMSDAFNSGGQLVAADVAGTESFTINVGPGGFAMGRNQKLTSLGTLQLTVTNGRATLSDITTLGDLRVIAPQITLRNRAAGGVKNRDGVVFNDRGVDYVASGRIDFSSRPIIESNSLPRPLFMSSSTTPDPELSAFSSLVPTQNFNRVAFINPNETGRMLALDGYATGTSSTELGSAIPDISSAIVDVSQTPVPTQPTGGSQLTNDLAALGISQNEMTFSEVFDSLTGRTLYTDLAAPRELSGDSGSSVVVSSARVAPSSVKSVADGYRALMFERWDGVFDANGQPRMMSRAAAVRDTLASAWEAYRADAGARGEAVSGAGFRAFAGSSEAGNVLGQIERIATDLQDVGLSVREVRVLRARLLSECRPANISDAATFEDAVFGSRLVVSR